MIAHNSFYCLLITHQVFQQYSVAHLTNIASYIIFFVSHLIISHSKIFFIQLIYILFILLFANGRLLFFNFRYVYEYIFE